MSLMVSSESKPQHTFDPAEMGAIAHLYRGEVYRSTIWRTRLDNTTNWSIVTMGIALSTTFSSPEASPLPLLLVGLLIAVFLGMEARRYRYFNVWRARARWLEVNFYAPIFTGEAHDDSWRAILASDYTAPRHHISFVRAKQSRRPQLVRITVFLGFVACQRHQPSLGLGRNRWLLARSGPVIKCHQRPISQRPLDAALDRLMMHTHPLSHSKKRWVLTISEKHLRTLHPARRLDPRSRNRHQPRDVLICHRQLKRLPPCCQLRQNSNPSDACCDLGGIC